MLEEEKAQEEIEKQKKQQKISTAESKHPKDAYKEREDVKKKEEEKVMRLKKPRPLRTLLMLSMMLLLILTLGCKTVDTPEYDIQKKYRVVYPPASCVRANTKG